MNFADWLINEMDVAEDDYCEYCLMVRPCDCDLGEEWGGEELEDRTDIICPTCNDPDCNLPWSHTHE